MAQCVTTIACTGIGLCRLMNVKKFKCRLFVRRLVRNVFFRCKISGQVHLQVTIGKKKKKKNVFKGIPYYNICVMSCVKKMNTSQCIITSCCWFTRERRCCYPHERSCIDLVILETVFYHCPLPRSFKVATTEEKPLSLRRRVQSGSTVNTSACTWPISLPAGLSIQSRLYVSVFDLNTLELNLDRQRSVIMLQLHISGTNSQKTAGIVLFILSCLTLPFRK